MGVNAGALWRRGGGVMGVRGGDDLGEGLEGGLRAGWGRGRGARGRAHRRGHALPAAATRSKFPPSLPGAGSRSPPTRLRPSRRQLGPQLPRVPDPAAFPVPRSALRQPGRPGPRPSRASTPPRRPRSPVPGSSRTGERGRAVSNWTSRAPLLYFLTLELEANKTLQPGKEVKAISCSGEYLKGVRIPCDSCLQLGKHSFPSQLCLQLNTKTWRRLPHPSGRRKEAARPDYRNLGAGGLCAPAGRRGGEGIRVPGR